MFSIPVLESLRQENNYKYQISLDYRVIDCHLEKKNRTTQAFPKLLQGNFYKTLNFLSTTRVPLENYFLFC